METEITNPVISLFAPAFDFKAWRASRLILTAEMKAQYEAPGRRLHVTPEGIAIIPVYGPILKDGMESWGEANSVRIAMDASRAMNDPAIKSTIIKFDTPGGTVSGTQLAADAISNLASKKKTIGMIEDACFSAGYWLAAQCTKIYMNAIGGAGSIGVKTELIDASKYFADKGIVVHPINTGKFKGIGDPSQPVTEDAKAYVRAEVDVLFSAFVDAVSSGRKMGKKAVREQEARIYIGQAAIDAGLVDGIATLESVYGMLAKDAKKQSGMFNSRASAALALARAR